MRIFKPKEEILAAFTAKGYSCNGAYIINSDGENIYRLYANGTVSDVYNMYETASMPIIDRLILNLPYEYGLEYFGLRQGKGALTFKRGFTPLGYAKYLEECVSLTPKQQVSWAYKVLRKRSWFVTTYDGKFLPKCLCRVMSFEHREVWAALEDEYTYIRTNIWMHQTYWAQENLYNIGQHDTPTPLACIIAHYVECSECGNIHADTQQCPICADKYTIHSYSTRAEHTLPFKDNGEKYPTYLGIELEYASCVSKAGEVYRALNKHIILKRDGSVCDGFEIVTCPGTLAAHKKAFNGFYDKVKGLDDVHNCGMHVHVDKRTMGQMQIGKILAFLHNRDNVPAIEALAGRSYSTNTFCKAESTLPLTYGIVGDEYGVRRGSASKYQALNYSPLDTIEVRIFAPPKDESTLFSRLEFVQALVDWTKPAICSVKDAVSWEKFKAFVNSSKKMYPNLIGAI